MSDHRTHGYDIVYQFSEAELSHAFEFAARIIPDLEGEVHLPECTEDPIEFEFNWWTEFHDQLLVDFDTDVENGIRLTVPFTVDTRIGISRARLVGRAVIEHPLTVENAWGLRSIVADFSDGVDLDRIDLGFTEPSPLPAPFSDPACWNAFRRTITERLADFLRESLFALRADALSYEFAPHGHDPMVPTHVDFVRYRGDASFGGALIVLLTTGGGIEGDASAFAGTPAIMGSLDGAIAMFGNDLLVHRLICRSFLDEMGIFDDVGTHFYLASGQAELRGALAIPSASEDDLVESASFHDLTFAVGNESVLQTGEIHLSGKGWTAVAEFDNRITVGVDSDGNLEITSHVQPIEVELSFEWWVWLLTIAGPFFTVPPISHVAVSLVQIFVRDLVEDTLEVLMRVSFPHLSGDFDLPGEVSIDSVFFDDLTVSFRGNYARDLPEPEAPSVSIEGALEVADTESTGTSVTRVEGVAEILRTTLAQAHEGAFVARARQLFVPLSYRWFIGDRELHGSGAVDTGDAEIRFEVEGAECQVWIGMGESVDVDLEVVVEDARGTMRAASLRLSADGTCAISGVTGADILTGPVADLFEAGHSVADLVQAVAALPSWGTRPDEMSGETVSWTRAVQMAAFREAIGRGMDMEPSDLPPSG